MGIFSSIISAGASLFGGERANSARSKEASKNRAFQERMSNTSYQRSMEDMRKAGLNPMLAYQKGGATTPSGAVAQVQDSISPAVSSAMAARRLNQELDNMEADEANKLADVKLKGEQAQAAKMAARQAFTQSRVNENILAIKAHEIRTAREIAKAAQYDNEKRGAEAKVYETDAGKVLRTLGLIRDNLGGMIPFTSGGKK